MNEDQIFRNWAWLMLAVYSFLWIHSIWMRHNNKTYFYSFKETPLVTLSLRLLLIFSMTGLLLYAVNPASMSWSALDISQSYHWLGVFIGLMGMSILYWSISSSGKHFISPLTFKNDQTLFTLGPYKWVRHPTCSVFVLLVLSSFLVTANWFIGVCGLLGSLIAILVRTPMEEKMLIEIFGTDYIVYMHKTGRYLPRIASFYTLSTKDS